MAINKITYIKLTNNIKLNDGSIVEKGTSVRMNYKEGPFYNVEINESSNIKKIFWITEDQGKISVTRNQKWNKKKMDEHSKDLNETWFDVVNRNEKELVVSKKISEPINNKTLKKRGRPKKIK